MQLINTSLVTLSANRFNCIGGIETDVEYSANAGMNSDRSDQDQDQGQSGATTQKQKAERLRTQMASVDTIAKEEMIGRRIGPGSAGRKKREDIEELAVNANGD
jgi:hypothetical protein